MTRTDPSKRKRRKVRASSRTPPAAPISPIEQSSVEQLKVFEEPVAPKPANVVPVEAILSIPDRPDDSDTCEPPSETPPPASDLN